MTRIYKLHYSEVRMRGHTAVELAVVNKDIGRDKRTKFIIRFGSDEMSKTFTHKR